MLITLLIILIACFCLAKFAYNKIGGAGENTVTHEIGEEVTFEIPKGSTTSDIADILLENGLIENTIDFKYKSKSNGYDGTFNYGTYTIVAGTDELEIMEILKQGANVTGIKVTIPEGYTIDKIGTLMEEKEITTKDEFVKAANSRDYEYPFIAEIPDRENLLEGYLFPDTYFFNKNTDAKVVVDTMLKRFSDVMNEERMKKVSESGYTLDEIVTISSIIESEIKVDEERALAASVIYNRLEQDMPLQMCSTVIYSLGIRRENLTLEDLEVDSPYNTYKYPGLPKGPISNPGEKAIDAALNPDDDDYLYFVLKADESGGHVFTKSYDEFLEAKAQYKQQF